MAEFWTADYTLQKLSIAGAVTRANIPTVIHVQSTDKPTLVRMMELFCEYAQNPYSNGDPGHKLQNFTFTESDVITITWADLVGDPSKGGTGHIFAATYAKHNRKTSVYEEDRAI
jgi:hypothetical protein